MQLEILGGITSRRFALGHFPCVLFTRQLYAKQHTVDDPHLYDFPLRVKLTFAR
jgi:hypothetical protein